ncbi:MAG: septum site-determining protein MinC [Clostridiaceae bacterium]|nr:septum site-determining protein MinC [Clostridiaceae bacterium]
METKGIIFKGNSEGLVIVIPENYSYDNILQEIDNKVSNASRFFKGARIKVTYRGYDLTSIQEQEVKKILDEKSGAIIESFSKEEPKATNVIPSHESNTFKIIKNIFSTSIDEGSCKFIRNTVRNGTRVDYKGHVVILGDVNPGAEIVASGNVVVLGTLRGMVHAGAEGDKDAFIYALKLRPTQIRIAEAIARMPEEDIEDDNSARPEMATAKDGMIVVEQI